MPNHDGTGPAKGCCKQEHQRQGGCGCANKEAHQAQDAGCCKGGEQHRNHGEHKGHEHCCKKQGDQ